MLNNSASLEQGEPKTRIPRSTLVSRNVTISGHRTSVRLEAEMWSGLAEICRREGGSLHEICTLVAQRKAENTSLTAAIRVFVMAYYRAASTEDGHSKARHGYGVTTMMGANPAPATRPMTGASPATSTAAVSPSPYDRMGSRPYSMGNNTRGGTR